MIIFRCRRWFFFFPHCGWLLLCSIFGFLFLFFLVAPFNFSFPISYAACDRMFAELLADNAVRADVWLTSSVCHGCRSQFAWILSGCGILRNYWPISPNHLIQSLLSSNVSAPLNGQNKSEFLNEMIWISLFSSLNVCSTPVQLQALPPKITHTPVFYFIHQHSSWQCRIFSQSFDSLQSLWEYLYYIGIIKDKDIDCVQPSL